MRKSWIQNYSYFFIKRNFKSCTLTVKKIGTNTGYKVETKKSTYNTGSYSTLS